MAGWGVSKQSRYNAQIHRALVRGQTIHKARHTQATFDGAVRKLVTFDGYQQYITGTLHCYHHATRVLSVDFTNDCMTDYGYDGYSPSTSRNIAGWISALAAARIQNLSCVHVRAPTLWTEAGRKPVPVRNRRRYAALLRFQSRAPWVVNVDGALWLSGKAYDQHLCDHFERSMREIFNTPDTYWRWFMYDWDAAGKWSRRYIDAAAERCWRARIAKTRITKNAKKAP
jgi:hypothetical protein